MCVCVCERERERERECVVCVCVWCVVCGVCGNEREGREREDACLVEELEAASLCSTIDQRELLLSRSPVCICMYPRVRVRV